MYVGRGSKRAYEQWLRDMVMDTVGGELGLTDHMRAKLERNTRPATPDRDDPRDPRPYRTANE